MAMDHNIDDTHRPAKKMKKLQEEENPKSQDDCNDPDDKERYIIGVNLKDAIQQRKSGGDPMALFRKVMKDAGCCDSQIDQEVYSPYTFVATLTSHEAKKLSDRDCVRGVKPDLALSYVR